MTAQKYINNSFLFVAGVASLLLIAACGSSAAASSSSGGGSGGSTQTINVPPFCSLLTADKISAVIGQTAQKPTQQLNAGGETDCDSQVAGADNVDWTLFLGPYCQNGAAATSQCNQERASVFAVNKKTNQQKNGSVTDVPGLGDQAYCTVDDTAGITIAHVDVLKAWAYVDVASDSCAHSTTLARDIIGAL